MGGKLSSGIQSDLVDSKLLSVLFQMYQGGFDCSFHGGLKTMKNTFHFGDTMFALLLA